MFIAHVEQVTEGCDYTISCGETIWRLEATTHEDAIIELHQLIIGTFVSGWGWEEGYWNEAKLGKVILFEIINEEEILLNAWYKKATELAEKDKREQQELEERRKYESLKEKYA